MIKDLRLLIREILVNELGTMGVTHPANVKKDNSNTENPEGEEELDQNQEETPE